MINKHVIREVWHDLWGNGFPIGAIIFLVPLVFTILFGFIYSQNTVKSIPLAIYDRDQTSVSRKLVEMYGDSERFKIVAQVNNGVELEELVHQYDALVTLEIPKNFAKDIKEGTQGNLLLTANSVNNMYGNAALSSAQEINRSFSISVGQQLLEGLNVPPKVAMNMVYPAHFGIRILNNPTNGYTQFMLAGLMLNGMQVAMMAVIGPILVGEIQRRRFGKDINSMTIFLTHWIMIWVLGMVSFYVSLVVCVYGFAVPMRGSWLEAGVLAGAFLFFLISVLMIFSACSRNVGQAIQLPMLYIMPGLLYSGLSYPSFDMSSLGYALSLLMPMTYTGDNLRDITLAGYSPTLWADSAYMLIIGLVCLLVAYVIFYKRRQKTFEEAQQEGAL